MLSQANLWNSSMKGKLSSRWMYLVILSLLVIGALLSGNGYPTLIENAVNTFGFLGFWITLYGLIVAIFEIARTGSVANQMALAAETSHNSLKRQIEYHDIHGCVEMINLALSDLEKKKAVSVVSITRIKQGYISTFSKSGKSESYDNNLKVLNSYEHITQSRANKGKANPKYATGQYPLLKGSSADHPYKLTIDTLKKIQDEILTHLASRHDYIGGA
jgi:hypothetical protein